MPPKRKAPSKKTDAPAPAPAPASEEEPTPAPSKRGKSTPKKDDEDIKSTPTRTSSRSQSSSQTSSQEIDQTPFQVDLTTTNREELVKRLKKLSAALASYQQKPLPILKTLAHQLIDRHITTHRSQEVRLLAACSIADLLRIFAPNPPYNQKELQAVFDLFFDQLKGLSEPSNPNYARYFYLLESLAVVNSCLILCQFKSDRPLITLFELFFHLMKDDPAPRVEFHILDILSQCVSELDVITPGVLDAILVNVIAPGKDDNPHAATLAMKLIDRHHDILERPISSLLIDGLFRPTSDGTQSEVVKERSDFLDLLYELNKHVPTLLVNLTNDQLELLLDEDANRRLEHVQVYGKLCTDADTAFVRANEPIFHGLLGRYTDVSTAIREQMAIFTQDFLIHHEFHRDLIVKNAIPILNDRDEKVRTAMYKAIAAAGLASADAIPKNLFEEFVKRTVDKKLAARRTTLDGLAHLFAKHCADAWKNGQPLSQAAKKYAMIPRKIIAVANIDQFMALNSEILLDETLLGLKNNVIERTRCMIGIMASMLAGAESRIALILERLMHDKNTAQQTIRSVLRLTADAKGRSLDKQQDKLRNMKVQQLAAKLVFNPQEEGVEDISQVIISLLEDRDKNVQKFLGILADPVQEYDALRTAKNELIRILRVDKQGKKLGALRRDVVATRLATKMQTTILNVETIPVLLAEIQQNVTQNRLSLASAGLHLLLIIARVFPIMLINSVEDLVSLYQMADANEEVTTKILQILSHCLSGSSMNKAVSNQLRDLLVDAATNTSSTPDRVTYAVKAIARLFHDERITAKDEKFDPADRILDDILKTLISTRLTVDGTNVVEALVACTQVAEVAPKAFHKHKETIVQFITKQLLPNEQSELLEARITSLSTLVAYLHSISSNTTEATTLGRPIMRMLLTILTRQGAVEKVKAEKSHQEKTEEEQEQEKAEHDALLLASATSLVDLCTRTVYFKLLVHPSASVAGTKPNFPLATLAMVAHHETEQVRLSFCKHIMDRFAEQSNKPPFVFATILSYMAHEHQHKIKQQYLKSLTNMITRQRQIVRILLDVQGDKHASQQLPEFYIAELIYLLSYHADWELDAEEFELYNYFWQLLSFYLDALISDKEQGHNFALILQITQSIKQCEDVRDPTNERIYLLAELAQLALRDKFQNKDWSHATHPGEITLPSYMYRARATPPKTRYLPESYTGPKSEKSAPGTPTKEKGIKRKIATPSTSEKGSAKKAKKEGGSAKKKKEPKEKAEPTRARLSRGAKQDLSYAEDLEDEDAMDEDEELTSPRAKAASTPKSSKKTTPSKKTPAKKEMEDEDEEDADIENKAVQDSFDFSEESAAPASASRARPKESVSSAIARLTSSKSKPAATSSSSTSSKGKTTSSTSKTAAAATANGKPASAKKAAPKAKPAADEEVEENDEEEEEPVIEKKEAPKRATPTKKTAAATSPKKASPKKAAAKTRASQAAAEEADENEATSPAVSTPSPSKKTRTRSPATRASPRQPVSSRALAAQEKPAANGATSKTTRGRANEEEEEEKEETKEEEEKEEEEEEETSTSAPAKGKQVQAKLSNYFGNAANKKKKTRR